MSTNSTKQSIVSSLQLRRSKLLEDQRKLKNQLGRKFSIHGNRDLTAYLSQLLQYRSRDITDMEERLQVFAFNLYCYKPQVYRYFQSILGLPTESFLKKFKPNLSPNFDNSILYFLSSRLHSFKCEENTFVLCIDKIRLNKNFVYDTKRDVMLGLHNVNGGILLKPASIAYVIELRSIQMDWSQLISYAFVDEEATSSAIQIANWCIQVITKLSQLGVKVEAVITEPDFITSEHYKVNADNRNYFLDPHKKMYHLYDVRYLIRAVMNCLIENDFYVNDTRISWHYIKMLYYQRDVDSTLISEINKSHIHPGNCNQRMQLKYAFEIFSLNVYNAFYLLMSTGVLPKEARPTALFVKTMSELCEVVFDTQVTARQIDIDHQIKILEHSLALFISIRSKRALEPLAFTHMRRGLSAMSKFLRESKDRGFRRASFASRLSMKPLEEFFSSVPRITRNGRRLRPTASQVHAAFLDAFVRGLRNGAAARDGRRSGTAARGGRPSGTAVRGGWRLADAARAGLLDIARAPPEAAPVRSALRLPFPARDYRVDLPNTSSALYLASFLLYQCMRVHTCPELLDSLPLQNSLSRMTRVHAAMTPPAPFAAYVAQLSSRLQAVLHVHAARAPAAGALRRLRAERVPAGALPCCCFPRELLLLLLVRQRLWLAVKHNNRLLRIGKLRRHGKTGFWVPKVHRAVKLS